MEVFHCQWLDARQYCSCKSWQGIQWSDISQLCLQNETDDSLCITLRLENKLPTFRLDALVIPQGKDCCTQRIFCTILYIVCTKLETRMYVFLCTSCMPQKEVITWLKATATAVTCTNKRLICPLGIYLDWLLCRHTGAYDSCSWASGNIIQCWWL